LTSAVVIPGPEFRRIKDLPRRQWDPSLVEPLSKALRKPGSIATLRLGQAQALFDLGTNGGGFFPLCVGAGKTLIFLLASKMVNARRPLGIMPAALIEKTKKEIHEYSKDWKIPLNMRIVSYESLGREKGFDVIEAHRPDVIVCDEVHKLKHTKTAVTRRVHRYMKAHPETKFVGMSGTIMTHSIRDFAHVAAWCLKANCPVPMTYGELELWAQYLDESTMIHDVHPGALVQFTDNGQSDLSSIRRGVQKRILDTPGVVGSTGETLGTSLYIEGHVIKVNEKTEQNFATLREFGERPDGWTCSEAIEIWRCARELALGLNYMWDPYAPKEWLSARKAWAQFVRETLTYSKTMDSELQVAKAVESGQLQSEEYRAWKAIKDTFIPNSVPMWHDDSALQYAAKWLEKGPGICWVDHGFFGERLSELTGKPYFRQGGLDAKGNPIEGATGAIIASVAANGTGRNLQRWHRNLVTSSPSNAPAWEQLLGRTHRYGQSADTVTVDLMIGCRENIQGFNQARDAAKAQEDLLGHSQKLLNCDLILPPIPKAKKYDRWYA
jgi:hypothetical protein